MNFILICRLILLCSVLVPMTAVICSIFVVFLFISPKIQMDLGSGSQAKSLKARKISVLVQYRYTLPRAIPTSASDS